MFQSKFFLSFLCIIAACLTFAADFKISTGVSPKSPLAGEPATFSVFYNGNEKIELPAELPEIKGIQWLHQTGQSTKMYNINGKLTILKSLDVGFMPEKEGEYTIPSIRCTVGDKKIDTQPIKIVVKKIAAQEVADRTDGSINMSIAYDGMDKRKKFYIGEQIQLHVNFLFHRGYGLREYPKVEATVTPQLKNPLRFIPAKQSQTLNAHVLIYDAVLYASVPGTYNIKADITGKLEYSVNFFDSKIKHFHLTGDLEPFEILPLPKAPKGAIVLRPLAENPRITFGSVPLKCNRGEPITIAVNLYGKAKYSGHSVPGLNQADCQVFPPEMKNATDNHCQILYTLIPNKPGTLNIDKTFAIFDVLSGEYRTATLKRSISVADASPATSATSAVQNTIAPVQAPPTPPAPTVVMPPRPDNSLHYIHTGTDATVTVPLWKNSLPLNLLIVIGGGLVAAVILLFRNGRKVAGIFHSDERENAKAAAMRALRKMPTEGLNEAEMKALSEALVSAMVKRGLPPDCSLSDALETIEKTDCELADAIRALAANVWLPSSAKKSFDAAFYRKLMKNLGKMLLFALVLLFAFDGHSAESAETQFCAEYDRGSYEQCIVILNNQRDIFGVERVSPALLYNLGTCHAALNTPEHNARAFAALEQAHKLAPRDADVLHNLNLVRHRLGMSEKYPMDTFSNCMMRCANLFRPDELLTALASAIALLLVALTLRKGTTRGILFSLAVAVILIAAAEITLQKCIFHTNGRAVVVESTQVYQLPLPLNTAEEKSLGSLPAGTPIQIIESREKRTRIQANGVSGWIQTNSYQRY